MSEDQPKPTKLDRIFNRKNRRNREEKKESAAAAVADQSGTGGIDGTSDFRTISRGMNSIQEVEEH